MTEESQLARSLKARHIQLIAIGGTIGVGLFLGSAQAVRAAGPGLLLGYAIGGVAVFFVMRALGELLTYRPVAGSFAVYAEEFCGPLTGFLTGWSYWFMWVVTAMAELTAIGIYVNYWFPGIPQWISALVMLLALYGVNLLAVRIFGEVEFWFALIKVAAIVLLIVTGIAIIAFNIGDLGNTASFSNLWSNNGFLPFGFLGVLSTLQVVMFAYTGVEMIGVTAGEAENPSVILPRATNNIIVRIVIFYIGSLVVIMAVVPWNQLSATASPFVFMFKKAGIPAAASVMNLVVITAAASSCNSGLFSTGRMLHGLALRGQGPHVFGILNERRVPAAGIHASVAVMLLGVVLNYIVPKSVFTWLTSITLVGSLWTWGIILLSHRNYRRAIGAGRARAVSYRMPCAPLANWLVLGLLVAVAAMLALERGTRVALYVGPIWFALLVFSYTRLKRNRQVSTGCR